MIDGTWDHPKGLGQNVTLLDFEKLSVPNLIFPPSSKGPRCKRCQVLTDHLPRRVLRYGGNSS